MNKQYRATDLSSILLLWMTRWNLQQLKKKSDCDRAIAILRGASPTPDDSGMFQNLAMIRDK